MVDDGLGFGDAAVQPVHCSGRPKPSAGLGGEHEGVHAVQDIVQDLDLLDLRRRRWEVKRKAAEGR